MLFQRDVILFNEKFKRSPDRPGLTKKICKLLLSIIGMCLGSFQTLSNRSDAQEHIGINRIVTSWHELFDPIQVSITRNENFSVPDNIIRLLHYQVSHWNECFSFCELVDLFVETLQMVAQCGATLGIPVNDLQFLLESINSSFCNFELLRSLASFPFFHSVSE